MHFLPVFSYNNFARAHTRIYSNETGLDKERTRITSFLSLVFREAGAGRGKCLDSSGNRGGRPISGRTSRWDGGLTGSSSKALSCFSGGKLWSVLPLAASTNANTQSSVWCWRMVSILFCGFVVVYFCIELFYFIHRHTWALKSWVTALRWTKDVSLALKISVRLSAGGGLSNQTVFFKKV